MSRSLHTNRDFEKLEPYEGKPSRTVLRGEEGSNALDLPDRPSDLQQRLGCPSALNTAACFSRLEFLFRRVIAGRLLLDRGAGWVVVPMVTGRPVAEREKDETGRSEKRPVVN